MAWATFTGTGNIVSIAENTSVFDQIAKAAGNLNIYLTILIFAPFLLVIGLTIQEIIAIKNRKIQESLKAKQETASGQTEVQEDPEEANREKERIAEEEARKRQEALQSCIDKELTKNMPDNKKQLSEKILSCIARIYEITQAEIFIREKTEDNDKLVLSATYAYYIPEEKIFEFQIGEGLIGQVAKAGDHLYLDELPEGYITVKSGLGSATPNHLLILPWKNAEGNTFAILEMASFKPFHATDIGFIEGMAHKVVQHYE